MAARAITSQDINALTGGSHPAIASRVPSMRALLRRVAGWYGRNRRYHQTVSDLSALSDHVLADIGISRPQISEIAWALSRRST